MEWKKYSRKINKRCCEYYLERGLAKTKEDAKNLVSQHQLKNAGVNASYYIERGYSKEEVVEFLDIINQKKKLHKRNRSFLKEKYGEKWLEHYEQTAREYRQKMEDKGIWIKFCDLDEWKKYKYRVSFLTSQTVAFSNIKHLEKRSKEWHLDHIFSTKQGFILNVECEIIASEVNLRIIHSSYNCSKKDKCDISLKKLYSLYENLKGKNNEN